MDDVQIIEVPGVGEVEFPTSMSDADITAAVRKLSGGDHAPAAAPPWAAALIGASQGIEGGLKGFGRGLASAPGNMARGLYGMLTTNPVETLKGMAAMPGQVAETFQKAGADPEAWGEMVGDATGQTALGAALPKVPGMLRTGTNKAASAVANANPKLLKATGRVLGGAAGAKAGVTGIYAGGAGGAAVAEQLPKLAAKVRDLTSRPGLPSEIERYMPNSSGFVPETAAPVGQQLDSPILRQAAESTINDLAKVRGTAADVPANGKAQALERTRVSTAARKPHLSAATVSENLSAGQPAITPASIRAAESGRGSMGSINPTEAKHAATLHRELADMDALYQWAILNALK